MKASWRKQQCPAAVLEQFDPTRFTRGADGICYQGGGFGDLQHAASILLSFIDVEGGSASTGERITELVRTIMEAGASSRLQPGFVLAEFERRMSLLEERPQRQLCVVGYVSLSRSLHPVMVRQIGQGRIQIGGSISRYRQARADISATDKVFEEVPSSYTPLKVNLNARSDDEALAVAHSALATLLGWWNHALTYGRVRLSFGGRPGPVAEIVLAPLRTLHDPSGKALDCWQYDPDFHKYPQAFSTADKWRQLKKAEGSIRRRLPGHQHEDLLKSAILAYHDACSSHVPDNAFLSLWTLLETLTGSNQGEVMIRRTLFLIAEKHREYCSWELRHLHYYRNCLVHRGDSRSDIERLVYQLKRYVDILLKWWLFHFNGFADKQEVFDVLDTSRDAGLIGKRIRILKYAMKHAKKAGH